MSGELQRFQEQEGTEPADLAAMAEYVDNCLSSRSRSFGVFRRDHKLPTKEQMRDLRLHAKRVPAMNLDYVKKHLLSDGARLRLECLLQSLHFDPRKHRESEPPPPKFRIPKAHAQLLAKNENGCILERVGCLGDIDISDWQLMRYFCVVEQKPDHERLRPIMWALQHLLQSAYESQLKLGNTHDHRCYVRQGSQAAAFDVQASFWHVPLPAEAKFAVVDEEGNVYRMTRLPYGVDVASEIMHIITSALAGVAPFCRPEIWPVSDGQAKVYIDGALFASKSADMVDCWRHFFMRNCELAGVKLNQEPYNVVSSKLVYLGMEYDFEHGKVRLKPNFSMPPLDERMRVDELERLMGKLIYAGTVLAARFDQFVFALKFHRRAGNRIAVGAWRRSDFITIWPSAFAELRQLYDFVMANDWSSVELAPVLADDADVHAVLVTDATLSGFGAVLLRQGYEPIAFGASWPLSRDDINDAETHAILLGLLRFRQELAEVQAALGSVQLRLLILVDNTTALARTHKYVRGPYVSVDHYAPRVWELIAEMGLLARMEHVSTRDNLADNPSRGRVVVDPELLEITMTRAWGRKDMRVLGTSRTCVGAAASRRRSVPTR